MGKEEEKAGKLRREAKVPKNAFVVPKTTMSAPIQKSYWAQSPAKNQFDALSLVEQSWMPSSSKDGFGNYYLQRCKSCTYEM